MSTPEQSRPLCSFTHIFVSILQVCAVTHEDQKRGSVPLELELQVAVGYPRWVMVAELGSSATTSSAFNHPQAQVTVPAGTVYGKCRHWVTSVTLTPPPLPALLNFRQHVRCITEHDLVVYRTAPQWKPSGVQGPPLVQGTTLTEYMLDTIDIREEPHSLHFDLPSTRGSPKSVR